MSRPVISLLTDFGPDGPAAVCRGVMLSIAPDVQIVDIGHNVPKYSVRDGAYLMWASLPYLPVGVHVGVVDPGVGTDRRPIAVMTGRGDILVGPDNGLLVPAARRLGGIVAVKIIENRDWMLPVTASTFHGRDIFAPVAAHLASGRSYDDVGAALDPEQIVDLRFPEPLAADRRLETAVLYIDSFGNVRLGARPASLAEVVGPLVPGRPLVVELRASGGRSAARLELTWEQTFGSVSLGTPLLYEDSVGLVALADNQGNAARRLGIALDDPVSIGQD
jgi:S-adenosylmethionine hydrolase